MCWAAASDWCEEQNMVLVPIEKMCPSWDGTLFRENKCPEFVGSGYDQYWSSKISWDDGSSYFALYVTSSGMVNDSEQYYDGFPLCDVSAKALCYLP